MRLRLTTFSIFVLGLPFLPLDDRPAQAQRPADRAERPVREPQEQSIWMRQKMSASQKILEGLTKEDFELIRVNAQAMQFMGYLESWARSDMPGYREQMQSFGFANGRWSAPRKTRTSMARRWPIRNWRSAACSATRSSAAS